MISASVIAHDRRIDLANQSNGISTQHVMNFTPSWHFDNTILTRYSK